MQGEEAAEMQARRFSVMSYNILQKSLGSNCIPWVMSASAEFRGEVEQATGTAWAQWKDAHVSPEYRTHFHKNMASGDYVTLRGFWSSRKCSSSSDLPESLTGVTFEGEDRISYADASTGQRISALTLRGVLRTKLPGGLGLRLFEHLMEEEEHVYDWAVRGPRVLQEILQPRDLREHDADAASEQTCGARCSPDVVVLQEYDAFAIEADYRRQGSKETFAQAMSEEGYDHLLFRDPLFGRVPPQGLGVFWRRSLFEISDVSPEDTGAIILEMEICQSLDGSEASMAEPSSRLNVDLEEHWHRRCGDGSHCYEQMPVADRRNVGLVRLVHRSTGKPLWVLACHLMTSSRDSAKTNRFPGEVRACELRTIMEAVARFVPPGEAVVLAGDFNTNVGELRTLSAPIHAADASPGEEPLQVDFGLRDGDNGCADAAPPSRRLHWKAAGGEDMVLGEAFEPVHRWGAGVGPREAGGHCTSRNASRMDWIDYIWYSERLLRPTALSDMRSPARQIPDHDHASDHLPLVAAFEWR